MRKQLLCGILSCTLINGVHASFLNSIGSAVGGVLGNVASGLGNQMIGNSMGMPGMMNNGMGMTGMNPMMNSGMGMSGMNMGMMGMGNMSMPVDTTTITNAYNSTTTEVKNLDQKDVAKSHAEVTAAATKLVCGKLGALEQQGQTANYLAMQNSQAQQQMLQVQQQVLQAQQQILAAVQEINRRKEESDRMRQSGYGNNGFGGQSAYNNGQPNNNGFGGQPNYNNMMPQQQYMQQPNYNNMMPQQQYAQQPNYNNMMPQQQYVAQQTYTQPFPTVGQVVAQAVAPAASAPAATQAAAAPAARMR
ncbi:MAG: hypothetical protein LBF72_00910 [Holosporales bacterium]|jgi:hypothetical protein|nr:hypothetical protein [Holosporales bacterium]